MTDQPSSADVLNVTLEQLKELDPSAEFSIKLYLVLKRNHIHVLGDLIEYTAPNLRAFKSRSSRLELTEREIDEVRSKLQVINRVHGTSLHLKDDKQPSPLDHALM